MKATVMVVDFGTSKVSCVMAEDVGSGCEVLGAHEVLYDGFSNGRWLNSEQVIDAVYDAVRQTQANAHRRTRDVYMVVPGDYVRVVCGRAGISQEQGAGVSKNDMQRLAETTPGVLRPDRYKVIHRSRAFHSPLVTRLGEQQGLPGPAGEGQNAPMYHRRSDSLVGYVLADTLFLRDANAIADELGLTVRGYIASSLGQAMAYISPDDRARGVALCDIGGTSTQIAVLQGEGMLYHDTLPVGGFHITSDLAYGLDLSLETAEVIKRRHVFGMPAMSETGLRFSVESVHGMAQVDHDLVSRIIEARCEELAEMIQFNLRGCGFRLGDRTPVFVSGGGMIMMRGALQYLSNLLQRPIRMLHPKTAVFHSPNHAALVGAADYLLAYEQENSRPRVRERLGRFFTR